MNYKAFGVLACVAAPIISLFTLVGLCITWLKPGGEVPGDKFRINHYGKTGLRHTCKMGADAFNEGCLVYQSSIITIVLCTTSFLTAIISVLHSLFSIYGGEDFEEDLVENAHSGYALASTRFILAISQYFLMIFGQLFAAVIAYTIGSHGLRKNLNYEFSAGWILLVLSTTLSFCVAVAPLVGLFIYHKFATLEILPIRLLMSFPPIGSLLIVVGLCTTFYANTDIRINALKLKAAPFTPSPIASPLIIATTATDLSEFCSGDVRNSHLCSLYKSSAANIAFVVFGLLTSVFTFRVFPNKVKSAAYVASFVFFFIGFVQYAGVGEKVKDDYDMRYGLGWIFSLVGLCLNGVGIIPIAILYVLDDIKSKLESRAQEQKRKETKKKLIEDTMNGKEEEEEKEENKTVVEVVI